MRIILAAMLALSVFAAPALGAPSPDAPSGSAIVTRHHGVFGGVAIDYLANVEESLLNGSDGKPAADLVTFSYLAQTKGDPAARPVLFVFNGGPGSSSIWQHLGLFGPRRLAFDDAAKPKILPPYRLEDNANCPLDVADIVLIDPVGTGFSHLLAGGKAEDFYGVDQDARATLDLIADWLTRHGRWNSAKFLVGESYGTVRAAVVAKAAMGGPTTAQGRLTGLTFNGVALLGQSMDFGAGQDQTYVELVPSFAATAWYHGKIDHDRPLRAVIDEARAFANTDYLTALWAGDRLSEADRRAVAERVAKLIGLPASVVLDHDLRISAEVFRSALLHDQGLEIGAYDARYTLPAARGPGDPVADDPAMGQYSPAFVAGFNDYLARELNVHVARPYEVIAFHGVNGRWDYGEGPGRPSHANFALELGAAMRRAPDMKLFIGAGDYDLVTPLGAAEYVAAHSGLPQDRVAIHDYESGHMAYLGEANARKLAADLRTFVTSASAP